MSVYTGSMNRMGDSREPNKGGVRPMHVLFRNEVAQRLDNFAVVAGAGGFRDTNELMKTCRRLVFDRTSLRRDHRWGGTRVGASGSRLVY